MDISSAIISPNASIFITEFSPFGSLLDINNRIRQSTTKVKSGFVNSGRTYAFSILDLAVSFLSVINYGYLFANTLPLYR